MKTDLPEMQLWCIERTSFPFIRFLNLNLHRGYVHTFFHGLTVCDIEWRFYPPESPVAPFQHLNLELRKITVTLGGEKRHVHATAYMICDWAGELFLQLDE